MGRPKKTITQAPGGPQEPEMSETSTDTKPEVKEAPKSPPEGTEKVPETKQERKGLSPQQKGIAKVLAGLGLTGAILYFSPYTLAELASLLAIPLLIVLIVMGLLTGVSVSGNGLMEAIGKPEFWSGIQSKLEAKAKELRARE